jgi:arsenite-transporting ATPase
VGCTTGAEANTGLTTPFFFREQALRLLLFGGKGGVGKTTCATATALRLAWSHPKNSFLLVSTDPAHSVADSLAGSSPPYNLETLELDARGCLATFKENHSEKLREVALRGTFLDDEDISQFLDLSLPGLDELMAFLEIARWVEEGGYDCIVVDTAPTGHTLRLLTVPDLIRKWLEAVDALLAKHRYMKQLFTGAYRSDELDEFLLELSGSVKHMEALLRDPLRCCFVPVMLAEALSIAETLLLLKELKQLRIPVKDILVNRLYPENTCPVCTHGRAYQVRELRHLLGELSDYCVWGLPIYPEEVRGVESLKVFWDGVSPLDISPSNQEQAKTELAHLGPQVERPANPISRETKFLLFAGKGGVGKTTLACATAVYLARDIAGREVFLFSTDPAHSLSACLDTQIGSRPTKLAPGLTAMEMDAEAEFEILKNQYAADLERFLGAISESLDLTFDRDVMERLVDLSPPGLDEVMALTTAIEFLRHGKYDILILDSAPTGHLIRLLETPELINQWLKVFFGLFLKYKRIFRLPKISQRLVQMSKDLKELGGLLRDSSRSALYGVTILTEMAFQETIDLMSACERLGVHVPALFLNLATPASGCSLCSAIHRNESLIKEKFEKNMAGSHQTLVYRQSEPRGLERLGELGNALYRAETKTSYALPAEGQGVSVIQARPWFKPWRAGLP